MRFYCGFSHSTRSDPDSLALALFFIIGIVLLIGVDVEKGRIQSADSA